MARIAKSLDKLRSQVNAKYPKRRKASDGWIGDARHRAVASDHNPNSKGVVTALDLTHHAGYFDAHKLADRLITYRHPNLEYVISNRRIAGAWTNWKWRAYNGSNPHTKHIHVSVGSGGGGADGKSTGNYDSTKAWNIATSKPKKEVEVITNKPRLDKAYERVLGRKRKGKEGENVYLGKPLGRVYIWLFQSKEYAKKQAQQAKNLKDLKASLKKKPAEVVKVVEKVVDKTSDVAKDTNTKVTAIFDYFSARWQTFRNFLKRK